MAFDSLTRLALHMCELWCECLATAWRQEGAAHGASAANGKLIEPPGESPEEAKDRKRKEAQEKRDAAAAKKVDWVTSEAQTGLKERPAPLQEPNEFGVFLQSWRVFPCPPVRASEMTWKGEARGGQTGEGRQEDGRAESEAGLHDAQGQTTYHNQPRTQRCFMHRVPQIDTGVPQLRSPGPVSRPPIDHIR